MYIKQAVESRPLVGLLCNATAIGVDSGDLITSNCVAAARRLLTNQTYILRQAVDCIVMIVNYPFAHNSRYLITCYCGL